MDCEGWWFLNNNSILVTRARVSLTRGTRGTPGHSTGTLGGRHTAVTLYRGRDTEICFTRVIVNVPI